MCRYVTLKLGFREGHDLISTLFLFCSAQESRCSLQDVLVFYTGADTVPVLGYEKQPKQYFLESPADILPTASTCDLHLWIPTAHKDNFTAFKDWMELGILGHCGFGVV